MVSSNITLGLHFNTQERKEKYKKGFFIEALEMYIVNNNDGRTF